MKVDKFFESVNFAHQIKITFSEREIASKTLEELFDQASFKLVDFIQEAKRRQELSK